MPLLHYHLRSLAVRWRSTLATVLGIAVVVAVFVLVQSLAEGLRRAMTETGNPANLLVARQGALAETTSVVTREQFQTLRRLPGIARGADAEPLATADVLVIIVLPHRDGAGSSNATIRGTMPAGRELRPQVTLSRGSWPAPGMRQAAVSRRLAERFAHLGIGQTFRVSGKDLSVSGHFDGGNTAFDSEIWMDADEARALFERDAYSSALVRVEPGAAAGLKARIESDRSLKMKAVPELEFYGAQTRTAGPIQFLGAFLAALMSVGAVFAAMNTLYAAVAARTREVGTLRVLGFRRRTVLLGFLVEGIALSLVGGLIGCALALPIHGTATSTLSQESFTELQFAFAVTPALLGKALAFSAGIGLVGSLLPAWRAARTPVISALHSS